MIQLLMELHNLSCYPVLLYFYLINLILKKIEMKGTKVIYEYVV